MSNLPLHVDLQSAVILRQNWRDKGNLEAVQLPSSKEMPQQGAFFSSIYLEKRDEQDLSGKNNQLVAQHPECRWSGFNIQAFREAYVHPNAFVLSN